MANYWIPWVSPWRPEWKPARHRRGHITFGKIRHKWLDIVLTLPTIQAVPSGTHLTHRKLDTFCSNNSSNSSNNNSNHNPYSYNREDLGQHLQVIRVRIFNPSFCCLHGLKNLIQFSNHWKIIFKILTGGPVVPSGNMSSPTATTPAQVSSHHPMVPTMVGYTTTGRPSTHQQQPMSFTRALEMTENIDQRGRPTSQPANPPQSQPSSQPLDPQSAASNEDGRRDSVYDMNSYEISVWRHAKKLQMKNNAKHSWKPDWTSWVFRICHLIFGLPLRNRHSVHVSECVNDGRTNQSSAIILNEKLEMFLFMFSLWVLKILWKLKLIYTSKNHLCWCQ